MSISKKRARAQALRVEPWFAANGDETLRLDYPLSSESVVLDVGGYVGDWTEAIGRRYGCKVHVFEIFDEFAKKISERFAGNDKVVVHGVGLGGENRKMKAKVADDSTSVCRDELEGALAGVEMKLAADFLREQGIERVDLLKVNIEGGEYELLEHLIESGAIKRVRDLQVQFHDFVEGGAECMEAIREKLKVTHYPTYQYEFVWENWRLYEAGQDQALMWLNVLGDQIRGARADAYGVRHALADLRDEYQAVLDELTHTKNLLTAAEMALSRLLNSLPYKVGRLVLSPFIIGKKLYNRLKDKKG